MDPLKNPENAKVVSIAPPPNGSFASLSEMGKEAPNFTVAAEQLEELTQKQIAARANEQDIDGRILGDVTGAQRSADPVREDILANQTAAYERRRKGLPAISSDFSEGDVVYHVKHHEEAKVRRIDSTGRVQVKFKNGDKTWVRPENLVIIRKGR